MALTPPVDVPAEFLNRDWLSIGEAARFTGLSVPTLTRRDNAGLVPTYRTRGGHRRFDRVVLKNLIRDGRL